MTHLGEMVRLYRVARKIEQKVLAERMGLSASQLGRLENGRGALDAEQLVRITAWLISEVPA